MSEAAVEVILFHGVYGLNIFLSTSACFLLSHQPIIGTFSHAWIILLKYFVYILKKKKKKRREKRLKPSNTLLVSAFVCFRVWERSRGDIDERKISALVYKSMKQRNYPHQLPCILTWGTGWLLGALGGVGSLGYRESLKNLEFFFFFNLY